MVCPNGQLPTGKLAASAGAACVACLNIRPTLMLHHHHHHADGQRKRPPLKNNNNNIQQKQELTIIDLVDLEKVQDCD